ncbi:hypothetical protein Nepgr_017248 [Nepenthes gracilis]|uniref:Uncharacterized protein n=1 Tax=Nepenthes gracilis TaxID=150966 RepID=A0AAD3SS26_NEPGR|nr:hypothetical protein Nepgr_017248 [Nepenthes gracilis]
MDSFHKNPTCCSQALETQRKSQTVMLEQESILSAVAPHHLHQGYQDPTISQPIDRFVAVRLWPRTANSQRGMEELVQGWMREVVVGVLGSR